MGPEIEFSAEVWLHDGPGGWHFMTLPAALAEEVQDLVGDASRPFGSIRVEAQIGETTWLTSIFRDKKLGSYVLPVKTEVRKAAQIEAGQEVDCRLRLEIG